MHAVWVVMGVSGAGKTTVAREIAVLLGWRFVDADDYHPAENVARMRAGLPLDDAMRWPWFDRLIEVLSDAAADGPVITACSALKRSYRDHLRSGLPTMRLIYLDAPRDMVQPRITARKDHYFDPALLDSQYAALEPPQPDEDSLTSGICLSPPEIARAMAARIGATSAA